MMGYARFPVPWRLVDRGRAPAFPADPDDLVRVHPGRAAFGVRDGRRRECAQIDRHHGGKRHAGLDLIVVLFVPSFFVVLQRFSEHRSRRAAGPAATAPATQRAQE
jgi:hypothetical protein